MLKTQVAIVKGNIPEDITIQALTMIGADKIVPPDATILIKPNYITAKHPSSGVTTDARVIDGIVKFFKHCGVESIIIGEGSGFSDSFEAFKLAGVDEVARRYEAKLIDLNKGEFVEVKIPNPIALRRVRVSKRALESNFIVSVPKLKVHSLAEVSLSLKNMMGVVSPKGVMHGRLDEKIVDLASIVKPNLAVIDGIVGCAGGELRGIPVKMNLVIAGTDPVATDTVGAAVMEINRVRHIRLAEEHGLGIGSLDSIEILGEPIEKVKKNFKAISNPKVLRRLRRIAEKIPYFHKTLSNFGRIVSKS